MAERQGDATERNAWPKMSFGKVHRYTLDRKNTPTRVHGESRAQPTHVYMSTQSSGEAPSELCLF